MCASSISLVFAYSESILLDNMKTSLVKMGLAKFKDVPSETLENVDSSWSFNTARLEVIVGLVMTILETTKPSKKLMN
jgi:hypothetical protein